jgi:hypothetical protein
MKFREAVVVDQSASFVLHFMMNRLEELVPLLPNVTRADKERQEELSDGRLRTIRRWEAAPGVLPLALRPFARPEWMRWMDTSDWSFDDYREDWTLSMERMEDLYDCSGSNTFRPHPDFPETKTLAVIEGELQVYPERVRGIPRFLAKKLAPQVEKYVISLLVENLVGMTRELGPFLDGMEGVADMTVRPPHLLSKSAPGFFPTTERVETQ